MNEPETETRPTHPEHTGTPAEHCASCHEAVYGMALDCAYGNLPDPADHDRADEWAREYVASGTVSPYWCTRHDPMNAAHYAAQGA